MIEYLNGEKLYGDDFTNEQITKWYDEESEAYANLGSKEISQYSYGYHELNQMYGFNKLRNKIHFEDVLGFGSAWGHEFEPIISKISNLTIVEPSDNLISKKIGNVIPIYIKPNLNGNLIFKENSFDLITCFGTLHHIPNVTFVLSEIIRVLKPGGFLLLREPIISMGNWNFPRQGLTKNERGIPIGYFQTFFKNNPIEIISCKYCFTMTSVLQRKLRNYLKHPIYSYRPYLLFDRLISNVLKFNVKYNNKTKISKIAPSSVFYIIKKQV